MNWTDERPWGRFVNLLERDFTKVKLMEVDSGKRLSYQSHKQRQESWTIVRGRALVTLDGKEYPLTAGDHIEVPQGAKHRIANVGNETLSIIEVQTGTYFGEDDIVRYQDDFGRIA